MHLHYEDQIRSLQNQFQDLLNSRIEQIQEDANHQIMTIKKQEHELQNLLEEKMYQIEQEYIQVSTHESRIQEKQNLIEKLKNELSLSESESRENLNHKLKAQEDRFRKEIEMLELNYKHKEDTYEKETSGLSLEVKRLESELNHEAKNNESLVIKNKELEVRCKEMVEDWSAKSMQLRQLYDEEMTKRKEAEGKLALNNQTTQEIKVAFQDLKQGYLNQSQEIKKVNEENENLRAELNAEAKRNRGFVRELEDLRNQNSASDNHNADIIQSLREQVDELKHDNKQLNDKIVSILQSHSDKFEKEVGGHYETKNLLKIAENNAQQKNNEIKNYQQQVERLRNSEGQTNSVIENLKSQILHLENENLSLNKEKQELNKKFDLKRQQTHEFKNQIRVFVVSRLKGIRRDLEDLRNHCDTMLGDLLKEVVFKTEKLSATAGELLWKQKISQSDELDYLKSKLHSEYNLKLQGMKSEFDEDQKEIIEVLEKKFFSKEKELEDQKVEREIIQRKLETSEREIERCAEKNYKLDSELTHALGTSEKLKKELHHFELKAEQTKNKHNNEIQRITNEMQKTHDENEERRKELQLKHMSEIRELNNVLENANKKIERITAKYEEQLKDKESLSSQEINELQHTYTERISRLSENINELQKNESERVNRIKALQEKITELEKERSARELEYQQFQSELHAQYQARIEDLEYRIEEHKLSFHLESDNIQRARKEKTREIEGLQLQVRRMQDDIALRNERTNALALDKTRLEDKVRELQRQLDLRSSEVERNRKELLDRQRNQKKEIEQLHGLLSKSYQSDGLAKESKRIMIENEAPESDLNKSIQGLKKLDKYLENNRSPNRSTFSKTPISYAKMNESSDTNDEITSFRKRNPLSVSQLKP